MAISPLNMATTQDDIDALHQNWIWVQNWLDSSESNTAGRLVTFTQRFTLSDLPTAAVILCTSDTRYKLLINGKRVMVGPSRSSPERWLYDTIDISPFLQTGSNVIQFIVMRYFYATRAAMPFVRTGYPGLTVVGHAGEHDLSTGSTKNWRASVDYGTHFPMGLEDDVFLHINERREGAWSMDHAVEPFNLRLVNGELPPWRLHPRSIPLPEQTPVNVNAVHRVDSCHSRLAWETALSGRGALTCSPGTSHSFDVLAACHSTAFTKWSFRSASPTQIRLKVTYSEGYELEPRQYPWLRTKADRLDATRGLILGPHDEVVLDIDGVTTYEPFWFRTFRLLRVVISCGDQPVDFISLEATQTNYPLNVKAEWDDGDEYSGKIMEISTRTMRNCMYDAYSDCPFYEQLSYSGDSRSVSLFHYLLSGDDRLARQTISSFGGSITPDGLTQSRYPSQVQQVIAGFSLYWVLQISDHYMYFGDADYTRSFMPRIDGVLAFFDRHIDHLGLVSGISKDVWQYVDWVTGWHQTEQHPDKGVPTAGRASNRHTYFSMLYAWTLQHAARLVARLGRPHLATEYRERSDSLVAAIRRHCYDAKLGLFTDSTSDQPLDTTTPLSQHVQIFAVLCGASDHPAELLRRALKADNGLGKCSYVMMFYAFRALSQAGIYDEFYHEAWGPWRKMINANLSTWEEDDVRQRSDCHAWGSVPVYEYLSEVAGLRPIEPGWQAIEFTPRIGLSSKVNAVVPLGKGNMARIHWSRYETGTKVELHLNKAVLVIGRDRAGNEVNHGRVAQLALDL